MSSAPILIFDSGVGGLTIHAAIAARLPQENYVYACDNAAFPYGPKPEGELVQRVHDVLDALIAEYAPKLLVVACNTASTVALPRLRQHYSSPGYGLPIVGVVPAIKPAAQLSKTKIIGLLATPGTVRRTYTDQLIRDFAADCTVIKIGSSELVHTAEAKLRGGAVDIEQLRLLMQPFFESPQFEQSPSDQSHHVDTIVLGCTHFPLLKEELAAAAPHAVNWIDSGAAIAERVVSLLSGTHNNAHIDSTASMPITNNTAVFTRNGADVDALRAALLQRSFAHTDILPIV